MSDIEIKDNDGIRWLTLNRPDQMNALTVESLVELGEAFDAASNDDNVRCLVITGNGRAFCSGADVEEWAQAEASGTLETYGWTEAAHLTMTKLASIPKPVVAMINGAAVGAGLDLALCCDFRYASDKAKFKALEAPKPRLLLPSNRYMKPIPIKEKPITPKKIIRDRFI